MKKLFMRLYIISFLLTGIIALNSCLKSKSDIPNDSIAFEIAEYKTNTLIEGATISLYNCTRTDILYGCQSRDIFATYTTDQQGKVNVLRTDYNKATQGIWVSKNGYWAQEANSGKNELCRVNQITVQIKKTGSYPAGSAFYLYNIEERLKLTDSNGRLMFSMNSSHPDTTITINAFGAENNTLKWVVATGINPYWTVHASGSLTPLFVPASGIVNTDLNF